MNKYVIVCGVSRKTLRGVMVSRLGGNTWGTRPLGKIIRIRHLINIINAFDGLNKNVPVQTKTVYKWFVISAVIKIEDYCDERSRCENTHKVNFIGLEYETKNFTVLIFIE